MGIFGMKINHLATLLIAKIHFERKFRAPNYAVFESQSRASMDGSGVGGKNGVFLKQCFGPNFGKTSSIVIKKRQFFAENILKIITSVPVSLL
jgi:hypothetical protein